ncbi:MAG: tRNA (guanosine(37)-N1)-methyltransferase TrmD [Candidatus Saganbacteria bacterium]|nr:tRNA (guanosine(37)-N1)-methyltransferase TrmD [Candidatus Saganbacteria bacterium]
MRFDILTLFPAMFEGPFTESLLKKARERGSIIINIHDIREETSNPHKTADDSPFGGGPGMVMLAEPIIKTLKKIGTKTSKTVFLTPAGKTLTQDKVVELSKLDHLVIICGHYEGADERIRPFIDEEISIGDYVLTGGELPAAVLVDAVSRYIPGVVKELGSVEADSFSGSLLDFPHYTRPADLEGSAVPEVLRSGNHEEVRKWRRKQSLQKTFFMRPDLLAMAELNGEDKEFLRQIVLGI